MTVKELIEILQSCEPEAEVFYTDDSGTARLRDTDVFADFYSVTFDTSVAALLYKMEKD